MKQRTNEIYKIEVINYPDNRTEVSKCLDPLFDIKLLLEGVGVLIPETVKWAKTYPEDLKQENWDLEKEDLLKKLHNYLDLVGKDYLETEQIIKYNLTP